MATQTGEGLSISRETRRRGRGGPRSAVSRRPWSWSAAGAGINKLSGQIGCKLLVPLLAVQPIVLTAQGCKTRLSISSPHNQGAHAYRGESVGAHFVFIQQYPPGALAEPLNEPIEMDSLNALRLLSDTVKKELGDHVSVCNCMCAHVCVCALPFSYCARSAS